MLAAGPSDSRAAPRRVFVSGFVVSLPAGPDADAAALNKVLEGARGGDCHKALGKCREASEGVDTSDTNQLEHTKLQRAVMEGECLNTFKTCMDTGKEGTADGLMVNNGGRAKNSAKSNAGRHANGDASKAGSSKDASGKAASDMAATGKAASDKAEDDNATAASNAQQQQQHEEQQQQQQATGTNVPSCDSCPNVMLLFPDAWKATWDGLRDPSVPLKLPTIAALAARGTRLANAIVAAPMCSPSRAALATGRAYDFTGVLGSAPRAAAPPRAPRPPMCPPAQPPLLHVPPLVARIHALPAPLTPPCLAPLADDQRVDPAVPTVYTLLRDAGYWTMAAGRTPVDYTATMSDAVYIEGNSERYQLCEEEPYECKPKDARTPFSAYLANQTIDTDGGGTTSAWAAWHETCTSRKPECAQGACDSLEEHPKCDVWPFPSTVQTVDEYTKEQALVLLRRRPTDQPFFLQVDFAGPHSPYSPTSERRTAVAGRTFPGPVAAHNDSATGHSGARAAASAAPAARGR